MPVHSFTHEATGETIDVYVAASAPTSEHQQQIRDGKTYRRVYSAPLAATDMGLGDCTQQDFRRKTGDSKRGLKVGDAWEISAEMSERRAQKEGRDPVREAFYQRHEQQNGKKHPDVVRREKLERANARLDKLGIRISL